MFIKTLGYPTQLPTVLGQLCHLSGAIPGARLVALVALVASTSLLVTRASTRSKKLPVAPGLTTSNKKLLGAPDLTTSNKDATRSDALVSSFLARLHLICQTWGCFFGSEPAHVQHMIPASYRKLIQTNTCSHIISYARGPGPSEV